MSPLLPDHLRWMRIPPDLPEVTEAPPARPGERLLLHHATEWAVARFAPATGELTPAFVVAEGAAPLPDDALHGRYLPLRSGPLAYYRDEAGRVVVQHRRRRVVVGPDTECWTVWVGPWRRLRFEDRAGRTAHLDVLDAPNRWFGPAWVRAWDFAWRELHDYDLVMAIVQDLELDTPRLV